MERDADAAVARRAARQHGVITRSEATELGMSRRAVEHRVRTGRWRVIGESVFAIGGSPSTFEQRLMAATVTVVGAVASHEAAARLHGFQPASAPRIVVTVGPHATRRVAGAIVHRTNRMPDHHVDRVGMIRVTSPVRTLLDQAAVIRPERLARQLDDQLARRRVSITELVDELEAHAAPGRRGISRLRPLLWARCGEVVVPPSELEARFARLVDGADLPRGTTQYRPPWGASLIGRVDVAYVEDRLVVELDGRTWHSRDSAWEADHRRDQLAVMADWRVVRFTWSQVVHRSWEVVETLQVVLGRNRTSSRSQGTAEGRV